MASSTPAAPPPHTHEQSLWLADVVTVGLLLGFVGLIYLFERAIQPQFDETALAVAGVVLAGVPALLWLLFFYRRDSAEPEPRVMVIGVFLLGLLTAAAVGVPVVQTLFDVNGWMYANQPWSYIAAAILVVGFTQQGLIYASIRFSVFNSAEYDGPTDGIIYATAAALGYATVLNVRFVIEDGSVSLTLAAIQIVLTTLAMASFAGIVGYFLGRERFEPRPVWWMTGGVVLAAVLNGVFIFLRGRLTTGMSTGGAPLNTWISLLLAALLAVGTALILGRLIARDVRRTEMEGENAAQADGQTVSSTVLVIAVTLLALGAGWLVRDSTLSRTRLLTQNDVSLVAPASWMVMPAADNVLFTAGDLRHPDHRAHISRLAQATTLADAAAFDMLNRGRALSSFRVLTQGAVELDGEPAYHVHYAYVKADPSALPRVIEGITYFRDAGDTVLVASFEDKTGSFDASLPMFERMASTLNVVESGG